jgi:hypothetical protein
MVDGLREVSKVLPVSPFSDYTDQIFEKPVLASILDNEIKHYIGYKENDRG